MDDDSLIELYFARNEQAIAETDRKYGKLCFQLADHILTDAEDARECVNDTYLSVWNKIPPTRPNHFAAFLCKITRNLSLKRLDYNLAQKRAGNVRLSFSEMEELLPDTDTAPEWGEKKLGEVLSEFLKSEKADARNVFLRKYYFFDSVSDIAARYAFSESKVKSMLFHTRGRLREYLKKEGIRV